MQVLRHLLGIKTVTLCTIDTEPLQLTVLIDKAQTVTIGKGCRPCHIERVTSHLLDRAHILPHRLRSIRRKDVGLSSMQEIGSKPTVERLVQIGCKRIGTMSLGGTTVLTGMSGDKSVKPLAVCRHDILHIGDVLQPSFYLKRGGTSLYQFLQMVALVHVLQRQEMSLMRYLTTVGIQQVKLHPTELSTGTTVGRTSKTIFRGIANATVTDTQSTMHENLQFDIGHFPMDSRYFVNRQFTCQDDTLETKSCQPFHFLHRTVVSLCRGMQYRKRVIIISHS